MRVFGKVEINVGDLGAAEPSQAFDKRLIQTRFYRAPEVLLRAPHSIGADIWSIACVVFELLTGEALFVPEKSQSCSISMSTYARTPTQTPVHHPHGCTCRSSRSDDRTSRSDARISVGARTKDQVQ